MQRPPAYDKYMLTQLNCPEVPAHLGLVSLLNRGGSFGKHKPVHLAAYEQT